MWRTVEAPDDLESTLLAEAGEGRGVLVDCLTLWLSNLMLAGADVEARSAALAETARRLLGLRVFVSNEVGLGLVPETPLGRRFRDAQLSLRRGHGRGCGIQIRLLLDRVEPSQDIARGDLGSNFDESLAHPPADPE